MNFSTSDPPFRFRKGSRPLLISMPHVGTHVPPALAARLTDEAKGVPDTDWHLERLYDFADALGASVLVATHSRYVIDLNRPPDDETLYPGQAMYTHCAISSCMACTPLAGFPYWRVMYPPLNLPFEDGAVARSPREF